MLSDSSSTISEIFTNHYMPQPESTQSTLKETPAATSCRFPPRTAPRTCTLCGIQSSTSTQLPLACHSLTADGMTWDQKLKTWKANSTSSPANGRTWTSKNGLTMPTNSPRTMSTKVSPLVRLSLPPTLRRTSRLS